MPTLERRIAMLEIAKVIYEDFTIIRTFVAPGRPGEQIRGLRDDQGKPWTRQPGESEEALIDRATREVKRNDLGVAVLTATA
jgi:hypothetical protein